MRSCRSESKDVFSVSKICSQGEKGLKRRQEGCDAARQLTSMETIFTWPCGRNLHRNHSGWCRFARVILENSHYHLIQPQLPGHFPSKMALWKYYSHLGSSPESLAPLLNLFVSSDFVEPLGCATHSEDCPACEADQTNLLPFTNNELGQITR